MEVRILGTYCVAQTVKTIIACLVITCFSIVDVEGSKTSEEEISISSINVKDQLNHEEKTTSIHNTASSDSANVCLSTNKKWVPFAATTMISIMENTKSKVNFFIMHMELDGDDIARINHCVQKYKNAHVEYIFIDPKNFANFKMSIEYISKDAFSRLLFADIRPDIEKVVYTDIDVAFNGDIKEIYNTNLNGKIIAAVKVLSDVNKNENKRLGLSDQHDVFFSGLLLIDCKKWRDEKIFNKLKKKLEHKNLCYEDQDLLNIIFENNYTQLPTKYCVIPWQLPWHSEMDRLNPFVVHYCGSNKPWIRKGRLDEYFWTYASKTNFFMDILSIFLDANYISKKSHQKTYKFLGITMLLKKYEFSANCTKITYFLFGYIPIYKIEKNYDI